jgi:hypothetical protein
MGYRLRMPAEIGEWRADLAGTEPEPAVEIGAAIIALINSSEAPGPPLVTRPVPDMPGEDPDPRELLDYQYQQLMEALQHIRGEVADELEPLLSKRAQRLQILLNAIRTEKETAKALITAPEARTRIEDATARQLLAAGPEPSSYSMSVFRSPIRCC